MLANYEPMIADAVKASEGMPAVFRRALNDYCMNRPVETQRGVSSAFTRYMDWLAGQAEKRSWTGNLETWGKHLVSEGMKPSSAKVQMSRVAGVFTQYFKNENKYELIDALKHVDKPKTTSGQRACFWLTKEQANALLHAPDTSTKKGIRDQAVLACILGAGLRRREVAELKWSQIQFRNSHTYFVDIRGKGDKLRSFPIPPFVHRALKRWADVEGTTSEVFCTLWRGGNRRQPMTAQTVWRVVETYCTEIGITKIVDGETVLPRPHDLRRTFARHYYEGGGDIKELQQILGHASVQTTERYIGALERPDIAQPAQYLPYSL